MRGESGAETVCLRPEVSRQLRLVILFVSEVDSLAMYYREGLGFGLRHCTPETAAWLETGDVPVVIHRAADRWDGREAPCTSLLWFETKEDLDHLRQRLLDSGVNDISLVEEGTARRLLYVRDPQGFHIGFYEPLRRRPL